MVKKAAVTKEYTHVTHPFPALYNKESEILILGSLPSVKSREQMFFYGHPQNRFWKVIAAVLNEPVPKNIEEKKAMLYRHHVALWDTIYSCDIIGSSDSSIKNVVPMDLKAIVKDSNVKRIFCNGKLPNVFSKISAERAGIEAKYFHQPVRQMQHIRWKDWLKYGKRKLEKCRKNKKIGKREESVSSLFLRTFNYSTAKLPGHTVWNEKSQNIFE